MRNIRSIRTKLLVSLLPVVFIAVAAMTYLAVEKVSSAQDKDVSAEVANANRTAANQFNG